MAVDTRTLEMDVDGNCSIVIPNLRSGKEYNFRVIAENRYGRSKPSPIAGMTTAGIPDSPNKPHLDFVTPTTAKIVWTKEKQRGTDQEITYIVEMTQPFTKDISKSQIKWTQVSTTKYCQEHLKVSNLEEIYANSSRI